MTQISIAAVVGAKSLAGALAGEAARPALEHAARNAPTEAIVLLDWAEVELLTSSFFLAAFWPVFWEPEIADKPDIFPLLYRVPEVVADEIRIALISRSASALFATGPPTRLEVDPFNLDEIAQRTLQLVDGLGEASAADLATKEPGIQKTAWSNRLALLEKKRILRRRKQGRQLYYSPCWR